MVATFRIFIKWLRTWKTLPVWSWVKAATLYKAGNYASAIRFYERGLKKNQNHPAEHCARMDLAYCLFRERRFQEAEKHLKLITSQLPNSKEAYMRLAKLQMWSGHSLDAAWTMRRALRSIEVDADLVALFMLAVLDNNGPSYLLKEVVDHSLALDYEARSNLRLQAARARLMIMRGNLQKGKEFLEKIVTGEEAPLEALLLFAEVLVSEGKIANARRLLQRALAMSPNHPRTLSLLAESYLKSGPFYNAGYAKQLATQSCQNTGWLSPREMHILAESYYHLGDRMSALMVASKAKQEGSRLLGTYRDTAGLDKLIQNLSQGTQA